MTHTNTGTTGRLERLDDFDEPDEFEITFDLELPSQPPGVSLFSEPDLRAALSAGRPQSGQSGADTGEESSREEAVRLATLQRYLDRPDLLHRPDLVANDRMVNRLRALKASAPNMAKVMEIALKAAALSRASGKSLRIPPVLLLGPPGAGKTRAATLLAEALGTHAEMIAGTSIQDLGPLVGYGTSWRGAGPGRIAKALLGAATASPLVFVDEIEKVVSYDRRDSPLDVLLPLLEPSTATAFRDNYLDVPMRADQAIWIFAANSLDGLSAALLDRCVIINVDPLGPDEQQQVVARMLDQILLDHDLLPADLAPECHALLQGLGLRKARSVLTLALGTAVEGGRDWPVLADIQDAVRLVAPREPLKQRVGFF